MELVLERLEVDSPGAGLEVDDDVGVGKATAILEASENLAHPSLGAVTHHRLADLAAGGNAEARFAVNVSMHVQSRQLSVVSSAPPIATEEVSAAAQTLGGRETLLSGR